MNFYFRILPLAILLLVANRMAAAKHDVSDDTTRNYMLKETVVEAKKPFAGLTKSSPTFSIDQLRIRSTGITDIADALHRLPGVTLRDYGGAGGLKTVSVRGLGAAHTAVSYDGLPLSDAQQGAIDLSRYSVENLSGISLVIGDNDDLLIPARMMASPATLMLSVPGLNTGKKTSLTTSLKVGSFGYISPYINFSNKLGQSLTFNINGEFVHAKNNYPFKWVNGKITTIERRSNSRMNSGHGEANLRWSDDEGNTFGGKIYYYDNDRQLPGPVLYYNPNGSHEHLRERNAFGQFNLTRSFNDKWKINAAAKFNWSASLYTDFGTRQAGNYLEENYFQREAYLTGNILFRPVRQWIFDYAADYTFNSLNSNLANDARPRRNSVIQSLTARWTQSRFTITARLIESVYINATGNKESEPSKNQNKLSPSVSLMARLTTNDFLYGRVSYKNIFRMPTFNEAFFNHFGSPDLKPESTEQINLGLTLNVPSGNFFKHLTFTGDIYRNWVTDRIVAVPYNMFVWIVTNVNSVIATGADLTVNSTLGIASRQQIVLSGTWSYQRAKIDVERDNVAYGKQIPYTPLNSGSFSIAYENPWANLVWHGQGVSARYTSNTNTPETRIPGYFEFGATLWREFNIRDFRFEIRLDVINILDKQYYVIARYPMPGRAWQATIKFKF